MKLNTRKFFKILPLISMLIQAEVKCMESEDKNLIASSSRLSAKICSVEEYDEKAKLYRPLYSLPDVDYEVFPRDDGLKYEALKNSRHLKSGENCLVEHKKDADEEFVFSNDLVDCVGLVVSEDMDVSHKRVHVAHLSRNTAEKDLENFITKHKFSLRSKVSITTSLQSDVLLLTYNKLTQAGFENIFVSHGPLIRDHNEMYIPLFMFEFKEKDPRRLADEVSNVVAKWTSRALIVSTATGSLFRLNPEQPNLDSKVILDLKGIKS